MICGGANSMRFSQYSRNATAGESQMLSVVSCSSCAGSCSDGTAATKNRASKCLRARTLFEGVTHRDQGCSRVAAKRFADRVDH